MKEKNREIREREREMTKEKTRMHGECVGKIKMNVSKFVSGSFEKNTSKLHNPYLTASRDWNKPVFSEKNNDFWKILGAVETMFSLAKHTHTRARVSDVNN